MLSLLAFSGICANTFMWYARPGIWPIWTFNLLIMLVFTIRHLKIDWSWGIDGFDWAIDLPEIDIDLGDISCGD